MSKKKGIPRVNRKRGKFRPRAAKKKTGRGRERKTSITKMLLSPQVVKSRGFLLMLVLFIFILVLAFFFGEGGLLEIMKARHRIDELKQNIADLEEEKARLIDEIEDLRKNPMALEKKAREKLWLMKKNEKVVVIVKDEDKKQKEKNPVAGKSKKNKIKKQDKKIK